jgi:glycosyltransferase involved in cell wall biosynthesis
LGPAFGQAVTHVKHSNMTRLHILYQHDHDEKPYGCSVIRLLQPLAYSGAASPYEISHGTTLPVSGTDIAIIERLWRAGTTPQSAQRLISQLRAQRARIIYTLDDDLLALDIPPRMQNTVRLFAREADGIIVSTEPLAERMRLLNRNTVVLKNQIDDTLFGPPREPKIGGEPVVMGYMGTPTHLHDLLHILAPLRSVLKRHAGRLRLELVGVSDQRAVLDLFEGLPVTLLPPDGHVDYGRFVHWMKRNLHWDFAIAPLRDTRFNHAKSDLKYLDYGALSIPGVFSAVPCYRDTIRHGENGLLARSDAEWETCLETLTNDAALRHKMALAARDHVHAERSLKTHATDWPERIQQVIAQAQHAA